jgi:hypothetical protein
MSVDEMEKYYEGDNFLYLVVEVIDLYFGFDLSTVRDYEIAAKIVTQSYSVDGINGKNVDAIIGGWKVSRVLPKWIKDSNCWIQFMNGYVAEKQDVDKNEEKEEEVSPLYFQETSVNSNLFVVTKKNSYFQLYQVESGKTT